MSQRARQQSDLLRKAFSFSASRRGDAVSWRHLEDVIARLLDQRHGALLQQPASLEQESANLERSVARLLKRTAPGANRAGRYRRAVKDMLDNSTFWLGVLDPVAAAFWRHSALAWMSLWHGADTLAVTAPQMQACFEFATLGSSKAEDLTSHPEPPRPAALGSFASRFRKAGWGR
jgi:hypothetical protein